MPPEPPHITASARWLIRGLDALGRLRGSYVHPGAVLLYAGMFALDYATGPTINLIMGYALLTCFVAWTLGERAGFVMVGAILAGMIALPWLRALGGAPPAIDLGRLLWNALNRALTLGLLAAAVSALRSLLALERWQADTDALTGVLNKGAFSRRMAETVRAARRSGRALALAYMDLDGFKAVNDRHGHSAGDRVLTAFAHEAAAAIRRRDLFARIGGDEFIALMVVPDCDRGDAVAEILHGRLSAILGATGYDVTCSMGALVLDADRIGPDDDFIAMADALMYEVKRSGKNALRVARSYSVGMPLRAAFPPEPEPSFDLLLTRIDRAEAAVARRAAA